MKIRDSRTVCWLLVWTLVLAACTSVFAEGPLALPAPATVATSVKDWKTQSRTGFSFDPILEVNPNRGNFSTEIPIELPPNLAGFSSLKLVYSSQNPTNVGLGIGWEWNLPMIRINRKGIEHVPFIATGALGAYELTPTSEDPSAIQAEVQQILDLTPSFSVKQSRLEVYRPLVEDRFLSFVRIISTHEGTHASLNKTLGWVVLNPNGSRWVFTAEGLPASFFNSSYQAVHFYWDKGLLVQIFENRDGKGSNASWTAQLEYTSTLRSLPSYTPQGFYSLPLGLKKIQMGSRELQFVIDEEAFLLRAGWAGGTLPLFQGKYSSPHIPSSQSVGNPFKRHDNQIPHRLDRDSPLIGYPVKSDPDFLDYLVDLNGDGRTDLVRFDLRGDKQALNILWEYCESRSLSTRNADEDGVERTKPLLEREIPNTVKIAIKNKVSAGPAQWELDPSLSLPIPRTSQYSVIAHKPAYANYYICSKINSDARAIFFVDLQRNGRKDLIDCGFDSDTQEPFSTVDNDTIQLTTFDGKQQSVKRRHSNLALSVLSRVRPDLVAGRSFANVFEKKGQTPKVYLQRPDSKALEKLFSDTRMNRFTPDRSFLVNSSQWVPVENPGFKCHQGSLFFDANHDGHVDVLTGNTLYLASDVPGVYHPVEVNLENFFKVNSDVIDMADTQLMVVDFDGSGKFQVKQARALETQPNTGLLELVKNGTTDLIIPAPEAGKLLSSVYSAWGGSINIDYEFQKGIWVPRSIIRDPGQNQPKITTQYEYMGEIKDFFQGLFIGFSQTREKISVDDARVAPRSIERIFFKDLSASASVFSSRARVNGTPALIRDLNEAGERSLKEKTFLPGFIDLGNRRILPYPLETQEMWFKGTSKTVFDKLTTRHHLRSDLVDWITDSLGNRLIPLKQTIETYGMGLFSIHSDQLLSHRKLTKSSSKYHPERHMINLAYQLDYGKNDVQTGPVWQYEYDDKLHRLISACEHNRCDKYTYDTFGRLSELRSRTGKSVVLGYDGAFPLPTLVTTEGVTEQRKYDLLTGRVIELGLATGASFVEKYTPDGILFQITGQESRASQPKTLLEVFGGAPPICDITQDYCQQPGQINVSEYDTHQTLQLDGFGRVEATLDYLKEGLRHSGSTRYGMGHEVIARSQPQFGGTDSMKPHYEAHRDHLGRLLSELEESPGFKTQSLYSYDLGCDKVIVDGQFKSSECKNILGHIETQSIGSETWAFLTDSKGIPVELPSLGIKWERNLFSEIERSQAELGVVSESMRSGTTSWDYSIPRIFTQYSDGKKLIDSFGFTTITNPLGQLLSAQKTFEYSDAKAHPTDTRDARDYQNAKLSQRTLSTLRPKKQTYLTQSYSHTGFGDLLSWKAQIGTVQVDLQLQHDSYGRPIGSTLTQSQSQFGMDLTYSYENGKTATVNLNLSSEKEKTNQTHSFIKNIKRDVLDRIIRIEYANGLIIRRKYRGLSGRAHSVSAKQPTLRAQWKEVLHEDPGTHALISRESGSSLRPDTHLSESFTYHPTTHQLISQPITLSKSEIKRFYDGRVIRLGSVVPYWNGDFLAEIAERKIYYDGDGNWSASCPKDASPALKPNQCIFLLDQDVLLHNNQIIALIRVEGFPVAVYQQGNIYPVVTDHLGSIRAQFSPDGTTLLWERQFSPWGEKTIIINPTLSEQEQANAQSLERSVLWSFAGLMEASGVNTSEGMPLYWSQSRVYSPAIREWMSVDSAVAWNPESLLKKPGNWHGVRYAANRPLEFVDPTGEDAVYIAFPDYKISLPPIMGHRFHAPFLGHAGVLLINNQNGQTKYYEYGRYPVKQGVGKVQSLSIPNVIMGLNGLPTTASLGKVMSAISHGAGHDGRISGAYVKNDNFKAMDNYAQDRMGLNSNPNRADYSLFGNNCATFARDTIAAGGVETPSMIFPSPNAYIGNIQSSFSGFEFSGFGIGGSSGGFSLSPSWNF